MTRLLNEIVETTVHRYLFKSRPSCLPQSNPLTGKAWPQVDLWVVRTRIEEQLNVEIPQ